MADPQQISGKGAAVHPGAGRRVQCDYKHCYKCAAGTTAPGEARRDRDGVSVGHLLLSGGCKGKPRHTGADG